MSSVRIKWRITTFNETRLPHGDTYNHMATRSNTCKIIWFEFFLFGSCCAFFATHFASEQMAIGLWFLWYMVDVNIECLAISEIWSGFVSNCKANICLSSKNTHRHTDLFSLRFCAIANHLIRIDILDRIWVLLSLSPFIHYCWHSMTPKNEICAVRSDAGWETEILSTLAIQRMCNG